MPRKIQLILWPFLLILVTALACNMEQQPESTPTNTPVPQPCRALENIDFPENRPASTLQYATIIGDFISNGGGPDVLSRGLEAWGVIGDNIGGTVEPRYDFNNDGGLDVLVTLHYLIDDSYHTPGQLLLFACDKANGVYTRIYDDIASPSSLQNMPQVSRIEDITGDGQPELIYLIERCTSVACFREPVMLTWDISENEMISLSNGFEQLYVYTDDYGEPIRGLPFAGIALQDSGDGRTKNIILQEGPIQSREGGPHRPAQYLWTWHGYQYLYSAVEYDQTSYMIHILRDADRLVRVGDYEDALALYASVAYEGEAVDPYGLDSTPDNDTAVYPELSPWGGILMKPENLVTEEILLKNYARYRLVLVYTALQDGRAGDVVQRMQQEAPWSSSDIATYFTLMASTFANTFAQDNLSNPPDQAMQTACQNVQQLGSTQLAAAVAFLGDVDYFGPALPPYSLIDLCPFTAGS